MYPAIFVAIAILVGVPGRLPGQRAANATGAEVTLISDEADAALTILRARQAGTTPSDAEWTALFTSAGYKAFQRREAAMGRPVTDESFRRFMMSDTLLARTDALARTLATWKEMDLTAPARSALAYLPTGTPLRATLFFEIKPYPNSYVFDLDGRRAIYLYVDPSKNAAQIANTVAHELHHTGIVAACTDSDPSLPPAIRHARTWTTAFGEGLAMLAAAGGPDIHPHALDDAATRARWDHDVANFNADLDRVQQLLSNIVDERISADSADQIGGSFFGVQGPWYTVGWKMAVTVERADGRARLVRMICRPEELMAAFNAALRANGNPEHLALWSDDLLHRLGAN